MNPLLTVLMTVHNGERYLAEAISSILKQSFDEFEFVIVDNASTDSTLKIIQSFDDRRIRIVRNSMNVGQTKALNVGLRLSHGRYIARLDADDVALPQRFVKQVEFLEREPQYAVVGSQVRSIDSTGRTIYAPVLPIRAKDVAWVVLFTCPVAHSAVVMRRDAVLGLGGYDESFSCAQDYALWSSLIAKGYRITNLADVLTFVRVHENQMTSVAGSAKVIEERSRVGQQTIKTRLGLTVERENVEAMYRLMDRFDRLSPDRVSSSLRLFYTIIDAYRCRTPKASLFYIRTLLSLGIFHTGIPFFSRVTFIKQVLGLICSTTDGYQILFMIREWLRPRFSAFYGNR